MGVEFTIRALVLHLSSKGDIVGDLESKSYDLLEARDLVESETGVRVDSVRVTMPGPEVSPDYSGYVSDIVESVPSGVIVSVGNVSSSHERLEEVVEETVASGLFIGILLADYSWQEARRLSRLIHRLADDDLDYATRLGINTLNEPILTPYYPLSYSPGDEDYITVSLTYPNYLASHYRAGGIRGLAEAVASAGKLAESVGSKASGVVGAKYLGADLSIAPWMKESALGLVEEVSGVRLSDPGVAFGVRLINEALKRASESTKTVGFNEVQLPVAEDLKLKARVSEGDVRARDMARLSGLCLAGLDMVVVPAGEDQVAGLILETAAYSRAKGKQLGVRIIPVYGAEPGDKVMLDRFGETPVMPV